jgi:hypothetical protein
MANTIDYFLPDIHPCFRDMKPNQTYSRTWGETVFDARSKFDENIYKLDYKLNNFAHRCDDFKSEHDGTHILFAGCSFTFGEGLPYMGNWSGKLYNKISIKEKTSGYYCLGFQNGITSIIIFNILQYCEKFGNPKFLFCVFPDSIRKIDYENENLEIIYHNDKKHKMLGRLDMYRSIMFLEKFCELNNIKLLWTVWDQSDLNFFSDLNFKNFLKIDDTDIYIKSTNYSEKNDVFYEIARDGSHPGLRYSDGLSNIFLEYFNE